MGIPMTPTQPSHQDADVHRRLRRALLHSLYFKFREFPYAAIELSQLCEECRVTPSDLNWNMVYLEKCGYVELGKAIPAPPFVASSASITAAGIELVEDPDLFQRRFAAAADKSTQSSG
jgi:hypothetical protein